MDTHTAEVLNKVKGIQTSFAHNLQMKRKLKKHEARLGVSQKAIPSYSITRRWSFLKIEVITQTQALFTSP